MIQVKRSNVIRGSLILAIATMIALFQNCAGKNFSAPESSNVQQNTGGPGTPGYGEIPTFNLPISCHEELQSLTVPVKLLFVVDVSGSNNSNPGSDPNKVYRGGSIQSFFADFSAKANFHWGFVSFSGSSAKALIGPSAGTARFSSNASDMQAAINSFNGLQDNGNTPYASALRMAAQAIQDDMGTSQTKYVVVFLSDGRPNPSISDNQLKSEVQNILNKKPGQVTFNSVYYGAPDLDASTRLRDMAVNGGGQFLDTNVNGGRSFPISNIVSVAGLICAP